MVGNSNKVSLQDTTKNSHLKRRAPSYVSKLGLVPAPPSDPFPSVPWAAPQNALVPSAPWRRHPGLHRRAAGKFPVQMHPRPICVPLIPGANNALSFHLLSGTRGSVCAGGHRAALPSLLRQHPLAEHRSRAQRPSVRLQPRTGVKVFSSAWCHPAPRLPFPEPPPAERSQTVSPPGTARGILPPSSGTAAPSPPVGNQFINRGRCAPRRLPAHTTG